MGFFIGRIIFLVGHSIIISKSFGTFATLQMGGIVDAKKNLSQAQQKRVFATAPPVLKNK